jgi:beta-glucosidase
VETAVAAAVGMDVTVACGGATSSEQDDRKSLRLDQHSYLVELGARLRAAGKPLAVLAMAPGAIDASWARDAHAAAALFIGGEGSGDAWADVVLGDVSPSGKLPVTLHSATTPPGPTPCTSKRCRYDEGLSVGWRAYHSLPLCWADGVADGVPCVAFPFGHGAGYTSFEYTWAQPPARAAPLPGGPLAAAGGGADNALVANMSVVVRNGGGANGSEVAQLYVSFPQAAGEPPLVLRAFRKTTLLPPGGEEELRFELRARDVSVWRGGWRPWAGHFGVVVGSSSRDARLQQTLTLA